MGSGFSGCTESSVVRVIEIGGLGHHDLNRSGGVHSDSCDSGISVSERGHRKVKTRRSVSALFTPELDSEDEDGVTLLGADDSQPPTPTPRPSSISCPVPLIEEYGSRAYGGYVSDPARKLRPRIRPACKSLRHSSHPSPMLLDHAIDEEDEEDGGEGDDKCPGGKAHSKPTRPRSARQRRSRTQTPQSRTATATATGAGRAGTDSACESSDDVTSDDCGGCEEADSDFLSIPDETGSHRLRPDSFTALMQRHKLHGRSVSNSSSFNSNDGNDWWLDEDGVSLKSRDLACRDPCWSRGSSFTLRSSSRLRPDGRMSKKASERSISSILLTTAVELDPTAQTPAASTNPACFAVSNPEVTQHILKVSTSGNPNATTLAKCMRSLIKSSGSATGSGLSRTADAIPTKIHEALCQKLNQLFVVRPAVAEKLLNPKPVPADLSQKLRDLFVVTDSKKDSNKPTNPSPGADQTIVPPPNQNDDVGLLSGAGDDSKPSQPASPNKPANNDLADNIVRPPLTSPVVSQADRCSNPERKLLKKKVSFSPDVPDVCKCSKNYRLRTMAGIARKYRRMNPKITPFVPRTKVDPGYVCTLCKKDCINWLLS